MQYFSSFASSQEAANKWPQAETIRIPEMFLHSWTDTEVGLIPCALFVQAVPLMQTESICESRGEQRSRKCVYPARSQASGWGSGVTGVVASFLPSFGFFIQFVWQKNKHKDCFWQQSKSMRQAAEAVFVFPKCLLNVWAIPQ